MKRILCILTDILMLSLVEQLSSQTTKYQMTCCEKVGCFQYTHPYNQRSYTNPIVMCPEGKLKPTLKLYRREFIDTPQIFILEEETSMDLKLNKQERAIFLVHDHKESGNDKWVLDMMKAILKKEPANVFIYDWKTGAHLDNFKMAASNTRSFGAFLGEMMDYINIEYDIPTDKMWCIGFGLGAHLCSLAVDQILQRISRITGLDPTGPEFDSALDPRVGLHVIGANFVDVIHTSAVLGTKRSLGNIDFFPNGGKNQPRCAPGNDTCDHESARIYFHESIKNNCFGTSRKCKNSLSAGTCHVITGAHRTYMGYNADKYTDGLYVGNYDVHVSGRTPFCDPWFFNDTNVKRVNKHRKTT